MVSALLFARHLVQALAAGLTALGALTLLALVLVTPGWGGLALAATTGTGLVCLSTARLLLRRRAHRQAAAGVVQLEAWLRRSRGRAEGAE